MVVATSPSATAPGLVVLLLVFGPFVLAGVWWWLGELERRRNDDLAGVAEWEQIKRDLAPRGPRSIP